MADIALDSGAVVTASGNGVNAITTGGLTTNGTNRGLVCWCHVSNTTPTAIAFTNDGTDLTWTQLTGSPLAIPSSGEFYCYHALAPTALSAVTFTLTFTGGGFPQSSAVIAAYTNIEPSDFIGNSNTGTANFAQTITANVTTSANNSLVVGAFGQTQNDAMTIGTNQTENAEVGSAGGVSRTMQGNRDAITASSGTSVTMNASWAGFRLAGMFAVELLALANSAPTVALNSPADTATISDTTPQLLFTGTDADANDVEYQVQISTANTFATPAPTSLTSGSSTTDATNYDTASVTPTANALLLLAITNRLSGGTPLAPTTVTGNGLTWVQVATIDVGAGWNRTSLYRAMGSAPTAGVINMSWGGVTQMGCIWSLVEFPQALTTGTNGSGAIVQSVTNSAASGTTPSATLGAFADTDNPTYGVVGGEVAQATTPGSGFTELHDANIADQSQETEWKAGNDTGVDFSWGSSSRWGVIAVEIASFIDKVSETDAGFADVTTPADTHPFESGDQASYDVQTAIGNGTYYWRVRAKDPSGSNSYGAWATTRSFILAGNIKTILGLAKASAKVVNGLAIASVKTWNGLA